MPRVRQQRERADQEGPAELRREVPESGEGAVLGLGAQAAIVWLPVLLLTGLAFRVLPTLDRDRASPAPC